MLVTKEINFFIFFRFGRLLCALVVEKVQFEVHSSLVIGPAPISHELSSIGAGSALRYEILSLGMPGFG